MDKEIHEELQNLANKLRVMWGNNPDADLVEKAGKLLAPQEDTKTPAKGKGKGASK